MEPITRRVFLKRAISGIGGVTLAGTFGPNMSLAQPDADMSRIVVVKHTEATDGVRNINAANVQVMMDESIKQLTGEATVADAWASLLPDFKEEHVVAIKVNCATSLLPTHPVVVDAIVSGLTAAGVPENNIIIYDIVTRVLRQCGFKFNMADEGVRCFAAMKAENIDEEGWGRDWDNPVDILGNKVLLSTILTRCDHLINVPVLKAHSMAVFTLSLKNHFGSLAIHPQVLHNNLNLTIPTLNNQEAIKDKTRLIVIDALFGCWKGQELPPDFAPNSLIVSRDPVAADYLGSEMINEERARLNMRPRNMDVMLDKAAGMGLGTNDPEKMELIRVELGPPEEEVEEKPEEEVGRAVDPTGSYKTQWGSIKTAH
jgi:uncharacterized protein (DUF362 family)